MYLRFDVGVPACSVPTKNRNEPVVGFRGRCEGRKVGDAKPSAFPVEEDVAGGENEFHSVHDKKIRYRQPDLFDPKLPLISRRSPRATLSFRSALNDRLIDFFHRSAAFFFVQSSRVLIHLNYVFRNSIRSPAAD